jgi:hypothetical protein
MRIDAAGLVPMYGWDTYVGGHGRMVGRLVGLVTVADGRGHEHDVGELTTYVAGVAAVAPALLLDAAALRPVDDRSYEVVMTDRGLRTTCLVELDDDRLPRAVSSDDRWCALPQGLVRARWTLDVTGWTVAADGRAAPTGTRATWDLPDGPFAYVEADLDVARLRRGRDVGAV